MKYLGRVFLLGAVILCGCAHAPVPAPMTAPADADKIALRNNAVSLLYDLLGDEKDVSKILIIKGNSADLGRLIKAISNTSNDAAKRLEQMAKADSTLNLRALELPAGEKATRAAIAKTKTHELLLSSGENFQFTLLMTQADALSYGWHLAAIAAENSANKTEARAFKEISLAYQDLYQQVTAMLKSGAKNPGSGAP